MERASSPFMGLRDILSILFKQQNKLLVVFGLTFVPLAVKTVLQPATYQATAKILLKRDATNISLSGRYFRLAQEEEINSELEILKSRPVMAKVYGQWRTLFAEPEDSPGKGSESKAYERGVRKLSKRLKAESVPGANVITIRFEGERPDEVAWLANAVAKAYVAQHVRVRSASESETFFAERLRATRAELDSLENLLKNFQENEGLVSYPKQESIVLDKLKTFDARLTELRQEIRNREARLQLLRDLLVTDPEQIVPTERIEEHPVVRELQARLISLRLKRNELRQKYTDEHRLLRDIRNEINQAYDELRAEVKRIVRLEEVTLAQLRSEERTLAGTVASLLKELRTLPAKGLTISRLTLAIEETKRVYSLLNQKYEEAKIAEMSDSRVAKVKILESATVPVQPSGPPRMRNLFLALLLALSMGLGAAFAVEFVDDSFSSKEEIEARLNLPVLATFAEYEEMNGSNEIHR